MSETVVTVVACLELGLALGGAILLWQRELRPSARRNRPAAALAHWDIPVVEFLILVLFIIGGTLLLASTASLLAKGFQLRGDAVTLLGGAGAQLGMIAGVVFFRTRPNLKREPPEPSEPGLVRAGATTFLLALPIVLVAAKSWELVLKACGLPTDRQSLIGMFAHADSIWMLLGMSFLAVVIAPVAEELVFRAGLFRFLRGHLPRWVALLAPALFFASLHVNWTNGEGLSSLAPLVVLAVVFSLAYERTGRIGTSIVAHALFNLNTILLIVAGVGA